MINLLGVRPMGGNEIKLRHCCVGIIEEIKIEILESLSNIAKVVQVLHM